MNNDDNTETCTVCRGFGFTGPGGNVIGCGPCYACNGTGKVTELMIPKDVCMLCGEGTVTEKVEHRRGFNSYHSECDTCGGEYASVTQIARNKKAIQDAHITVVIGPNDEWYIS